MAGPAKLFVGINKHFFVYCHFNHRVNIFHCFVLIDEVNGLFVILQVGLIEIVRT